MRTMITAKAVEAAKPEAKPYKLADIEGLYLRIATTGAKSWRHNYSVNGKQKTHVYGRYPHISLAEARRLHIERKSKPLTITAPSFESVMNDWLRVKLPTLSNQKHQIQVANTLERYVLPVLGARPVGTIKRAEFVAVLKAVEKLGILETAHRVAGRIRAVMDYAVDLGHIEAHPAAGLVRVIAPRKTKRAMICIPVEETPQLLRAIESYPEELTRLALQLMTLTFVRVRELTHMRWGEFKDDVWIVPADRMKARIPHVVPLSKQAIKMIDRLRAMNGDSEYVFQSPRARGKPISENTLLFALYRLGYRGRMTAHGFRSLASTVLNQQSDFAPDVIERQLAHKEKDDVRLAYNRAEYLPQRQKLMQWWADFLDGQHRIV